MPIDPNTAPMLDSFVRMLKAGGHNTAHLHEKTVAVASVLADARLYCTRYRVGWKRVCALAEQQHGCDLGALEEMQDKAIDLRATCDNWNEKV